MRCVAASTGAALGVFGGAGGKPNRDSRASSKSHWWQRRRGGRGGEMMEDGGGGWQGEQHAQLAFDGGDNDRPRLRLSHTTKLRPRRVCQCAGAEEAKPPAPQVIEELTRKLRHWAQPSARLDSTVDHARSHPQALQRHPAAPRTASFSARSRSCISRT